MVNSKQLTFFFISLPSRKIRGNIEQKATVLDSPIKSIRSNIDFCGRWTSCKFEEGTTSQLLVLLSAKKGPMYQILVGISANGYPFSDIPTDK